MSSLSNFLYGLVINFALVSSTTVNECYNMSDNGTSYLGKATRTDCITWKEANSPYAKYYEDHKYCRNPLPGQVPKPYCYVNAFNSEFRVCDTVKICEKNCTIQRGSALPPCEVLVTCQPPTPSPYLSWNPFNRTLFYEGETIEFHCTKYGSHPTIKATTCLNSSSFEHTSVRCTVPVFECYNQSDNGANYLGKGTRTDCITWKEANSPYAKYYEDHKYCRNPLPGQVPKPYCYVNAFNSEFRVCDTVNRCDYDCFTSPGNGSPMCDILATCDPPAIFPELSWSPNRTLFYANESVNLRCHQTGYVPTINSSMCLTNGSFERFDIKCLGIPCHGFPDIQNMFPINTSRPYRFPENVTLSCQTGYDRIGPEIVYCTDTGSWSQQPNCTGRQCPKLGTVQNSLNNHTSLYRFPDSVTISCEKGYKIVGQKELSCNSSGAWDQQLPSCTGIDCQGLNITNLGQGQANTDFKYPTNLTLICELGYIINGSQNVSCDYNGRWSALPTCIGVKCDVFPIIEHMETFNSTIYRYPSSIKITCKDGYNIEGPEVVKCTNNGSWSKTPICTENRKASNAAVSTSTSGPIVGGSVGAVVVLIVVVTIVVITKRRQMGRKNAQSASMDNINNSTNLYANSQLTKQDQKADSGNDEHAYYDFEDTKIATTAIKVDEFYEYVHNGRDKDGVIEKEFNLLKTGLLKPATTAQLPANTKKNKYKNIYPYDETRVVLDMVEGTENSDYVNASFINGFDQLKQYIASQGPLTPTVVDWWRMVWQFNCGKIVMLTRVFEMGKQKCIQYWPELEEKTKTYGDIEVCIAKENVYSDFTIRTLKLTQDKETKTVKQFHYTAWPDKDVPKYASSLVHFRHQVMNTKCTGTGPLVVHCSAGIGRTGTYIALDYAVKEAKQLGYVDVFRCVETLRRQRLNMVQTSRQYVFLHESVLEALMCKDAGIPAAEFRDVFQQLMKKENDRRTQLEKDYELMMNMGHKHDEEVFDKGKSPENKTKNRYKNILPVESEMPILTTYVEGLNDYINAVFLPGYKNNKTFLITQMPLETTVIDLWRMIWDYNVEMIVMMNQSYEQKEVYWPTATDKSSAYGPFSVSLQDMQTDKVMTKIHLKLSYKNEEPRELKVLQSTFWSDDSSIPSSMDDFITFMTELEREHEHQGNGPVVVHCSNGCDKSGLYCVMATVIERLKIEQDVDIQHIIKNMRNRRPQIIPNFDQYRFLHEAVIRYLQQFETYSNFQ